MKSILFFIAVLCSFSGMGQLEQIVLESHLSDSEDIPEGYQVFRLYADLVNPDDYVRTLAATNDCASLEIKTTGDFYNAPFGTSIASPSIFNLSTLFPEILVDSYLTIGIDEDYNGDGNLDVILNNSDSLALSNSFELSPGSNLILEDGGIANLNPELADNGFAIGPENKVLLAQLTTNGKIYYKLNLEVLVHGDPDNAIKYFWQITEDCGSGIILSGEEYQLIRNYHYCNDPLAINYDPSPPEDGIATFESCTFDYVEGCTDPFACNYEQEYNLDDGSCIYPDGCTDQFACNYLPEALCDNGSCEYGNCDGCTDPLACNFDFSAIFDDGTCQLPDGCTDSGACNYEFWADCDDGSCEYLSCEGCTDIESCNYNIEAQIDDGSCEYISCLGCTDSAACNFDPLAQIDDGTCSLPDGCTDVLACNFDPFAMCDDSSCEYLSCLGCTDNLAINYSSSATIDDGSCLYPCIGELIEVNWNSGSFTHEISWQLVDLNSNNEMIYPSPEVLSENLQFQWCLSPGCYKLNMFDEFGDGWNGSSISYQLEGQLIQHSLESGNTSFDIISISSSCEIDGCTNSLAINFSPVATLDDGSCLYEIEDGQSSENELQIRVSLQGWNGSDDALVTFTNLSLIEATEFKIQDVNGRLIWEYKWTPINDTETVSLNMLRGDGWYLLTLKQSNQKIRRAYLKLSSG